MVSLDFCVGKCTFFPGVSCPVKPFYGVPSYRLVLHTSLCFISTHVNCCSTVVRPCTPDHGCLVLHECVVLPCSSPGQCSAPQTTCGMEGLSTGGLFPRDSTLHITTTPLLPHPSPPSPPLLPHPLSSLTPSHPSYCVPLSLSFLRCATLPSALWGGYRPCTLPARCCSSSDSPPSQTSPGREQLVLSLHT